MADESKGPPIEIRQFEPWMLQGLAELHAAEYRSNVDERRRLFDRLFNSDYARQNGVIPLVGVSGERVIALQSYIPWPYVRSGSSFRALQSGATLVSPDFRGRKLFQRMLKEGTRVAAEQSIDFLMGFPVPMSHGGFMKDGWTDLGKLRWWTRPLRPVKLVVQRQLKRASAEALQIGAPFSVDAVASAAPRGSTFHLTSDRDYLTWRYRDPETYRLVEAGSGGGKLVAMLKVSSKHGFREVLIGTIRGDLGRGTSLARILRATIRAASADRQAAAVTIAVLRPTPVLTAALAANGFIPHQQLVPLIVKPIKEVAGLTSSESWTNIFLEDIDTW